jgi:hypothetical protein
MARPELFAKTFSPEVFAVQDVSRKSIEFFASAPGVGL